MKKLFLLSVFVLISINLHAQWNFKGLVESRAIISGDENSPFWLHSNQMGRIDRETNLYALAGAKAFYPINENSGLEIGGNLGYSDGRKSSVFIDEAYTRLKWKSFKFTAGIKHNDELYNGLSVSNENIIWSQNGRALPGYQLRTVRPIFINKSESLGFEGLWSDYLMEGDRYVSRARLHRKSFHLIYNPQNSWKFKLGIQHFAQWGGESVDRGPQPSGFSDYLRIVAGRGGGESALIGEQINALGNHLGSYELYIDKNFNDFKARFIYNSIFEDGSGSRLANFPDGRYGIFIDLENKSWMSSFIYEFYYTKHQSQSIPHLWDNYFNNGIYASGWTYKDRVIGLPFFTTNYYKDYPTRSNALRVGNNLITAHHFGISGFAFEERPYKILLSFRNNHGHNLNRGVADYEHFPADDPRGERKLPRYIISTYFEINLLDSFLDLDAFIGADYSKSNKNIGGGVNLKKTIF